MIQNSGNHVALRRRHDQSHRWGGVSADTALGGDRVFIAGDFRWVNGLASEIDTVTSLGIAAYRTADSTWEAYDLTGAPSWAEVRSIQRIDGELLIGGEWLIDTGPAITSGLAAWTEAASQPPVTRMSLSRGAWMTSAVWLPTGWR